MLQNTLQGIIKKHKRVLFNGDNYSAEWVKEAEKRGLPNLRTTPDALSILNDEKNIALFEKYNVLTKAELNSRYEVFIEQYDTTITIEGGLASHMARTIILPAAIAYQKSLLDNLVKLASIGISHGSAGQQQIAEKVGSLIDATVSGCDKLDAALASKDSAAVIESMGNLRASVDQLELEVDDNLWPLPKYSEMLFTY